LGRERNGSGESGRKSRARGFKEAALAYGLSCLAYCLVPQVEQWITAAGVEFVGDSWEDLRYIRQVQLGRPSSYIWIQFLDGPPMHLCLRLLFEPCPARTVPKT
jgi:hypothetical protein